MIKNPYQKDYQNELKQNRHGLLVTRTSYQGDFYVLPFDEQQKRRTGILNVIWTIALWVIELGTFKSGFVPHSVDCIPVSVCDSSAWIHALWCGQLYRSTAPDAPGTL